MKRRKITHWRFWALLTNKEKVMLYPSLSKSEKKRIWTDEYMKVVKLNTYPHYLFLLTMYQIWIL